MNRVLYATSARRAIIEILRSENRYFTVAELFDRLHGAHPKLARSTVYRTLELLEDLGGVSRRVEDDAREASFVYCGESHHHHATCRICGVVEDVACEAIDEIRTSLLRRRSFELDEHTIEFFGRCARCVAATRAGRDQARTRRP